MDFDALESFAEMLAAEPLRLSSVEQTTKQLASIGIEYRLADKVEGLNQRFRLRNVEGVPALDLVLPGDIIPVQLRQVDPREFEGIIETPWEFFYLQLSYEGRIQHIRIYGACSGALNQQWQTDPTVPVINLCEAGCAVVRVLLGEGTSLGMEEFYSSRNQQIHVAKEASRMLHEFVVVQRKK